jgi:hypothetical protein
MPYGKDFTALDSRRPRSASDGGERLEAFARTGKPPGMGFRMPLEQLAHHSNQRF